MLGMHTLPCKCNPLSARSSAPSAAGCRPVLKTVRRAPCSVTAAATPEHPAPVSSKPDVVSRLLAAKDASGMTYTQIADEVGLSNVYTVMLFMRQQQLKPHTAAKLKQAVPTLSDEDVKEMQRAPSRRWDPNQIQDPTIYRLHEATMLAGEAIKSIVNEEFDDGIMSAIGFHVHVKKMEGKEGEPRVVVTMNGKFLPFVEQNVEDDVTRPESQGK